MKTNWLKIASTVLTVGGALISVASAFVDGKLLDSKIAEKVAEASTKK